MYIFDLTTPPSRDLVPPRADSRDVNMGEAMTGRPEAYHRAQFILLGCPQGGSSSNEIRRALYRFPALRDLNAAPVYDLGDTHIARTSDETLNLHREVVHHVLSDEKRLIILGDTKGTPCSGITALTEVFPDTLVLNVDGRFDIHEPDYQHTTPYRRLLWDKVIEPARLHLMGGSPVNTPMFGESSATGAHSHPLASLRESGVETSVTRILSAHPAKAIFWGIDIDTIRSGDLSVVTSPPSIALTPSEACQIATVAGRDPRTRIVEFTRADEGPNFDERCARLVAMMILYYLKEAISVVKGDCQ